MTETTATRLAAAIVDARVKAIEAIVAYRHDVWTEARANAQADAWNRLLNKPEERKTVRPGDYKDAEDAALTRLERLCVAQGRWEEHTRLRNCADHQPCNVMAKIEALLREET